jgi:hypothetical protein
MSYAPINTFRIIATCRAHIVLLPQERVSQQGHTLIFIAMFCDMILIVAQVNEDSVPVSAHQQSPKERGSFQECQGEIWQYICFPVSNASFTSIDAQSTYLSKQGLENSETLGLDQSLCVHIAAMQNLMHHF